MSAQGMNDEGVSCSTARVPSLRNRKTPPVLLFNRCERHGRVHVRQTRLFFCHLLPAIMICEKAPAR